MIHLNQSNPLEHARQLLDALDESAPMCGGRGERMAVLAERIARKLGLSEKEVSQVRLAAELHDLGKLELPASLLAKPETLDSEEWEVMKRHAVFGAQLLADSGDPELQAIAPFVRHHHESFSGRGYPDGLAGEQIPLCSRIIAVADAYDAMSSQRPYRRARNHRRIVDVMSGEVGIRWDPDVFAALLAVTEKNRDYLETRPQRPAQARELARPRH